MIRHKWSAKSRPDPQHTYQTCNKCGMTKLGRHEGSRHWTEFYLAGRAIFYGMDATPPCGGKLEVNDGRENISGDDSRQGPL